MFDRAFGPLISITIVCAAAALAVFAGGFAVYAFALPYVGAAGAAAIVVGFASLAVAGVGIVRIVRRKAKEEEAKAAQAELSSVIPEPFRGLMKKHPAAAIAATIVGGVVAARNPRIIRELVMALRRKD
jgi:hypothetical protein